MSWAMASLLPEQVDPIKCRHLGLLHDIGKLVIPQPILWQRDQNNTAQPLKPFSLAEFLANKPLSGNHGIQAHGRWGKKILAYLGFDSLYQQVAHDHYRHKLIFENDEPIDLALVVIADFYSALLDPARNKERGVEPPTIDEALTAMRTVFSDPEAKYPSEAESAFFNLERILRCHPEGIKLGNIPTDSLSLLI